MIERTNQTMTIMIDFVLRDSNIFGNFEGYICNYIGELSLVQIKGNKIMVFFPRVSFADGSLELSLRNRPESTLREGRKCVSELSSSAPNPHGTSASFGKSWSAASLVP